MEQYVGQTILGQFKILEEIGRGGMGSVFKAEQPMMERLVAVKILHPRLASRQDLVLRFRREARAMSALTHPNTARVLMFGQMETGALYIIMEFLDGANMLQVERKEGPLPPERAANIMIQICGALGEAHDNGIIHRDLKPENIVLTSQGGIADFPKVLDFGLAKMKDPDPVTGNTRALTQAGAVFGTPEFMSPEQARGEVLDARSDIYSLCVILYEMLTCKLPFKAKSPMDFISKHIKARPIPVHERVNGLTLEQKHWPVMQKALAKKRDDRFQTCHEFAEGLQTWLNGSSTVSVPAQVTTQQDAEAAPEPEEPEQNSSAGVHSSVDPGLLAGIKAKPVDAPGDPQPQQKADEKEEVEDSSLTTPMEETSGGLSTGAKVGIGVGALVLLAAIVAIVMMLT